MGTGPQPAAYANSATGAQLTLIIRRAGFLVNLSLYLLQWGTQKKVLSCNSPFFPPITSQQNIHSGVLSYKVFIFVIFSTLTPPIKP